MCSSDGWWGSTGLFNFSQMKIKLTLSFLLFAITFFYGQQEPLNKFDANGKKDGKWIVWLDKDWKLAKDSMTAVYFRYNYWDHGTNLYPMGPFGGSYKLQIVSENSQVKKGNAKLLDGEYKWVNDKGHMFAYHILKEGVYLQWKEYHKNGNLMTYFDYTKECEDRTHSFYIYSHDKTGKLKSTYPCQRGGKGVDGGSFK